MAGSESFKSDRYYRLTLHRSLDSRNPLWTKWIYSTMYTLPYPFFVLCSQDIWLEPNLPQISLFSLNPSTPAIHKAKVLFVIYLGFSNAKVFLRKVKCRGLRTGSVGPGMDAVSAAARFTPFLVRAS